MVCLSLASRPEYEAIPNQIRTGQFFAVALLSEVSTEHSSAFTKVIQIISVEGPTSIRKEYCGNPYIVAGEESGREELSSDLQ